MKKLFLSLCLGGIFFAPTVFAKADSTEKIIESIMEEIEKEFKNKEPSETEMMTKFINKVLTREKELKKALLNDCIEEGENKKSCECGVKALNIKKGAEILSGLLLNIGDEQKNKEAEIFIEKLEKDLKSCGLEI